MKSFFKTLVLLCIAAVFVVVSYTKKQTPIVFLTPLYDTAQVCIDTVRTHFLLRHTGGILFSKVIDTRLYLMYHSLTYGDTLFLGGAHSGRSNFVRVTLFGYLHAILYAYHAVNKEIPSDDPQLYTRNSDVAIAFQKYDGPGSSVVHTRRPLEGKMASIRGYKVLSDSSLTVWSINGVLEKIDSTKYALLTQAQYAQPNVFQGLSGSPVFIGDSVVGLFTHVNYQQRKLIIHAIDEETIMSDVQLHRPIKKGTP